jgi:hypothetical protein
MTQGSLFIAFQGGLDQVTQAMIVPRGRVIGCNNYQSSIQGYRRCDGYERYDGRQSPTAAGQSFLDEGDYDGARAARDAQRALIQAVPGTGAVRGVVRLKGVLYAWRDAADGTKGVMFAATSAGWQAVPLGYSVYFTSGGVHEIVAGETIAGATSGKTALVRKVITTSGTYGGGDAAGYLVLDTPNGAFTANENINIGANTNVATLTGAPAAQSFPVGGRYVYRSKNFYGSPDSRAVYVANGVGRAFEFDGTYLTFIDTGSGDALDKPHRVAEHKNRLFLAFPGGSVQGSAAGVPTDFSGLNGAFEIAMGDEVTDFLDNNIDSLAVICERSVHVITGSTTLGSAPDLNDATLTDQAGGLPFTAQKAGKAIYLDNSGVRSLDATAAYGNFKIGSLSLGAQKFLDGKKEHAIAPVASLTTPKDDLYRLFFADGSGMSIYFGRKNPEPMLFHLGRVVTCICVEQDSDGVERSFFGSVDGVVYQLDVGTSYDGAPIQAYISLPFDTCGAPRQLKQFDKVILSSVPSPETKIGFVYQFDHANGEQPGPPINTLTIIGGGGDWNTVDWNDFQWSAPINSEVEFEVEGLGTNMGSTFVCDADDQRAACARRRHDPVSGEGAKNMNGYYTFSDNITRYTLARAEDVAAQFSGVQVAFDKLPSPVDIAQNRVGFLTDTGGVNAIVTAFPTVPDSYGNGMTLTLLAAAANTGAATINVNELGVKSILRADGAALSAGDISAGSMVRLSYDGTAFRLMGGGNVALSERLAAQAFATSALMAPGTSATSSQSFLIGTGVKVFPIQAGKLFSKGQKMVAASAANPLNSMTGTVVDHDNVLGNLTLNISSTSGAGTFADWILSLTASVAVGAVTGTGLATGGGNVAADQQINVPAAAAADILAGTSLAKAVTPKAIKDSAAFFALTDAATIAWDTNNGFNANITLGANRIMGAPTNGKDGWSYTLKVIQGGAGGFLVTWNAIFDFGSDGAPVLSTVAGKADYVSFLYDAAAGKYIFTGFRKAG